MGQNFFFGGSDEILSSYLQGGADLFAGKDLGV